MKDLTVTDIVPSNVLFNIAKRVRALAVQIARSKGVPSRTREGAGVTGRTIGIPEAKITANQIEIGLTLNEIGMVYEFGSGEKAKGGGARYPIRPKRAKMLAFYENARGTWVYSDKGMPKRWIDDQNKINSEKRGRGLFPGVMHPGVKPKPFLQPAKDALREQNLEDVRKAVSDNVRLIIRGMARKV